MPQQNLPASVTLVMGLDDPDDTLALREQVARVLSVHPSDVGELHVQKRSIDARKGTVKFLLQVALGPPPDPHTLGRPLPQQLTGPVQVIVVGDGPCGLFCAYELARKGIKSMVLDRGKTVQPRRLDLKGLNRHGVVDPDSNYCFGEGGAGTYSDGKLYTRATKRGDVMDVLETLVVHNAPVDILTEARPHIGSNLLPMVVTAMRERLQACGVEFHFGAKVVDLLKVNDTLAGVVLADGTKLQAPNVVIATGHSARDVYRFLHTHVKLSAKPFALGVRIEHPQPLINAQQYGKFASHPKLTAASYSLVENVQGRGVFSFCMCPGGFIVPASTEASGLVVNGMSLKRRDSPFANSGLVVAVEVEDALRAGHDGPFACMEVQRVVEEAALAAGGGQLRAPAIRVGDYIKGKRSLDMPATSYQPGLVAADVARVLDAAGVPLSQKLRQALQVFGKRIKGYDSDDGVLVGVESRTSAPIRIAREKDTLMSPDMPGFYPAGEGAGYAGGIVSAAIDGVRVAHAIAAKLT